MLFLSFYTTGVVLLSLWVSSSALAGPVTCIGFYASSDAVDASILRIRQNNAYRFIKSQTTTDSFFKFLLEDYLVGHKAPKKKNEFSLVRAEQSEKPNRDKVVEVTKSHLRQHGVSFDLINSQMYKGREALASAPYLTAIKIRPSEQENAHPINILAGIFKRFFDVNLVYDPSYMDKQKFTGAWDKKIKQIYVSHEFIERLSLDSTLIHEAAHAYFGFLRETGKHDNIFNSILFEESGSEMDVAGYNRYMSFEELLAHSLSIRGLAWELTREAEIQDRPSAEVLKGVQKKIVGAIWINKNAVESLSENLDLLLSGRAAVELSENGKQLAVKTIAKKVLGAKFLFVDRELISLYRRSPSVGAQEAIRRAIQRVNSLQGLAADQVRTLKEMEGMIGSVKTRDDAVLIEKLSRILWRRALREVIAHQKVSPLVVAPASSRMSDHVLLFEKLLPTSGFKNLQDLQETMDRIALESPAIGPLKQIIRNNQFDLVMYRKSRSRGDIVKNGFLNSHQSGRSGGDLNAERRVMAESSYFGMTPEAYRRLDDADKPKYLIARFKDEPYDETMTYGDDAYIFSVDKFADQLTFTLGDSLNKIPHIPGYEDQNGWQANVWDQVFVPWKYRELMIPEIWPRYAKDGKLGVPIQSLVNKLLDFFQRQGTDSLRAYRKSISSNGGNYLEVQKFGPLEFSDAIGFQFNKAPPTGHFLKALLDRKMTIYDGRGGRRTIWQPSAAEQQRLLLEKEQPIVTPKYSKRDLESTLRFEDRVKVKWRQGIGDVSGLGWVNRIYSKGGDDYLEITQIYRGDEYINVSIPIKGILDFRNLTMMRSNNDP